MSKDAAVAAGAIAMFGEKYGDQVRVVSVGGYSTELCGGTHVDTSSDIHLFKIANESGIAAGVRRIIAYTSEGAFHYLRHQDDEIKKVRDRLKASSVTEIEGKIEKLQQTEKDLRKQIDEILAKASGGEIDAMMKNAKRVGAAQLVTGICTLDAQGAGKLRDVANRIIQKHPDAVVVLGLADPGAGKAFLLAASGPKAPKSAHAGQIIQAIAPLIGGKGGGSPQMAQAAGTDSGSIERALKLVESDLAPKWA
jgi:alanyl-tRNA synthetase